MATVVARNAQQRQESTRVSTSEPKSDVIQLYSDTEAADCEDSATWWWHFHRVSSKWIRVLSIIIAFAGATLFIFTDHDTNGIGFMVLATTSLVLLREFE